MPTANEIAVLQAARGDEIASRDELANFMAQISSESGGLTRLEEGFHYTRGVDQIPVDSVFREGREAAEAARLEAIAGRPQELARLMYGGRMGNDDAGDGYLYRGRGFIQLTGEDNYHATGADAAAGTESHKLRQRSIPVRRHSASGAL
jgi:putative chitinase